MGWYKKNSSAYKSAFSSPSLPIPTYTVPAPLPVSKHNPEEASQVALESWAAQDPSARPKKRVETSKDAKGTRKALMQWAVKDKYYYTGGLWADNGGMGMYYWLKQIKQCGGETFQEKWYRPQSSVEHTVGWASSLQLKVIAANRGVWCIDATPVVVKDWRYRACTLYTFLVAHGELETPVPAAFVLTSSNCFYGAEGWLEWLHRRCGLRASVFIMACAPGLYRAIRSIYRDSEVLFSTSSVKQKWSKKLTQMNVKEPSIRLKVEKTLAEMRSTMDYDKLVELWQNIDNQFPSEIKPKGSLKAWLEKWIAPKAADRWAAFNRQELWKIYAEVTLEHWHAELKAKYLRPCKTFNVDDILYTLTSAADACFIVAADKRTKTIPRPMTAIEKIRRNGFTHQMATLAATGTRTTAASNPSMSYDESNRRERAYGVPFEEARRAVNVVDIRRGQVEIESLNWTQSSYNKAVYTVVLDLKELEIIACTCPDFATTRGTAPCKHMFTFERVSGMYAVRRGKALQAAFPTPSTVSMPSSSSTSAAPVARTNTSVGCGKCKNCALNRAVAAIESLQKVHLEGKAKMSADATTATKAPLEDKAKKSVEATKPTSFLMCGFEAESSTSLALAYAVLSGVEASKQAKWTAWRAQQTTRYGAVARARAKLAVALNQLTKGVDSDKKAVDVSSLSDEQLKLLADGMDRIAEWTSKIGPKL